MPKQAPESSQSLTPPTTLPHSQEGLSLLLRALEKLLNFLEPNHHGQRMRRQELRRTLQEPLNIVTKRPFLQAITKAHEERFAQGGPSISAIVPYVDAAELRRLRVKQQAAQAKMNRLEQARPTTVQAWKPCIEAFAEVVAAEAAILKLFRDLQQRVILALDEVKPAGEEIHLTVPEIAKQIFRAKMQRTSPESSERLVRKWIRDGRIQAHKVKRGLYAISTSHLEILKEANR